MLARRMQMAAAGALVATYAEVLQDDYGASEVWPLVDIASGTTISAFINGNRDGTLQGWDLQNSAGPVPGTLAPNSDGANDYGDVYTSNGTDGLIDIWQGGEISIATWFKMANSGIWSDGLIHNIFTFFADGSNFIIVEAPGTSRLDFRYRSGGVSFTTAQTGQSTASWVLIGLTASETADEMKAYYGIKGGSLSQVGTTKTGLGTWAGTPISTNAVIGSLNITPDRVHDGYLAYTAIKFGVSVWTLADYQGMFSAADTSGAD